MCEQKCQHSPSTERSSDFHKNAIRHYPAVSHVVSETVSFSITIVLILLVMRLPPFYMHMWGVGVATEVLTRNIQNKLKILQYPVMLFFPKIEN